MDKLKVSFQQQSTPSVKNPRSCTHSRKEKGTKRNLINNTISNNLTIYKYKNSVKQRYEEEIEVTQINNNSNTKTLKEQ